MRRSLLDYLRCPACNTQFDLIVLEERNDQLQEGLLCCTTKKHVYPIVRAIPRILPTAFEQEPEFSGRHREMIAKYRVNLVSDSFVALHSATMASFGREWTTYNVQRPAEDEAYFRSKTGVSPDTLQGKLVLEAGCGSGRYLRIAGEAGATVIGVDLSAAVETAASVVAHLPNAHVIQANIFELPFSPASFDFVYSLGVLHHTPNTKQALDRLIPLLRPGSDLAIWLYPRWPILVEAYNNLLRAITTRISLERMHQIAVATEPIGYLKLRLLTSKRWLDRALGQALRALTIGVSYHPDREIRICDTFDWFAPPYQWHHTDAEVEAWLRDYGLAQIINLSHGQQHYQYNYGNGVNFKARCPSMG
jgi:SAM-dependent methyltransferase